MLSGSLPLNPEPKDYLDAANGLQKYSDRPITLVDALLGGLSHKLKVPVWTFDRHFIILKTNVWRPSGRH
jgi:predicted nucleic acid-binding protein